MCTLSFSNAQMEQWQSKSHNLDVLEYQTSSVWPVCLNWLGVSGQHPNQLKKEHPNQKKSFLFFYLFIFLDHLVRDLPIALFF